MSRPQAGVERLRLRLGTRSRSTVDNPASRRAAVLVPLLGDPDSPHILFFERTHDVFDHKGEICFPGGSAEPGDDGPASTALREAFEELALPPSAVDVIGLLDDVETRVTNYTITPVVGFISGSPVLRPDSLEVARIITVSLERLLDPEVALTDVHMRDGTPRRMYSFRFDGNNVWGATGRITRALVDTLRADA